jgi:23S rRNA (cytidine1920-2'-O)/16S rRNA (cytidine1409-2'-O)-methyltransferase
MIRLDLLLVQKGLVETREKAKKAIKDGIIYSGDKQLTKPGLKVQDDFQVQVKGQLNPYVSRGGYKLEKAIQEFNLNLENKIMLDIGSSTGGFTDCGLQNNVKLSYALDVGSNQLAEKIRTDNRVIVMENTNFRYVEIDRFDPLPNFVSIDVSFISLSHILPKLSEIIEANGEVVALVKPQFEAGPDRIGKNGIVKDKKVHYFVLDKFSKLCIETGFSIQSITYSPITGGDGNIEFLAYLRKSNQVNLNHDLKQIIEKAHLSLK